MQSAIGSIMSLAAKSAVPSTGNFRLRLPSLNQVTTDRVSLFAAPDGYLPTESLVSTLYEQRRPVLWLNLDSEDADPATFLVSLIQAAQRLHPGVGSMTLAHMRSRPGPAFGWQSSFVHLAQEFSQSLPGDTVIVLERASRLYQAAQTLALTCHSFIPALPSTAALIMISDQLPPKTTFPFQVHRTVVDDLSITTPAMLAEAAPVQSTLPVTSIRRAIALTQGRAVALAGLLDAESRLGQRFVQEAIERARNLDDLLTRVALTWQTSADSDSRQAVALAVQLGYCHPDVIRAGITLGEVPAGPWLQSLADGWARVRQLWESPLQALFNVKQALNRDILHRVADYWARAGVMEEAIRLFLRTEEWANAANAMNAVAGNMMNLGQWQSLDAWFNRLPSPALSAWPWLVYIKGEISAARGQMDTARRGFTVSSELFRASHDAEGACQSLLAESALAIKQGDLQRAKTLTITANTIAEQSDSVWYRCWTAWQLGCLEGIAGNIGNALACLERAATAAEMVNDPTTTRIITLSNEIAHRQHELRQQIAFHQKAYLEADRNEHEVAGQWPDSLSPSLASLDTLLSEHNWARIPLSLKLSSLEASIEALPVSETARDRDTGLWRLLLKARDLFDRSKSVVDIAGTSPDVFDPQPLATLSATSLTTEPANPPAAGEFAPASTQRDVTEETPHVPQVPPVITTHPLPPPDPAKTNDPPVQTSPTTRPTLTVHMLGQFRVLVNDRPVENWPSGRGRAVFQYLLTHHATATPRDVLMDLFWPEAKPEAARNNLNVAMHGLRRATRAVTDLPVVIFKEGAYHLNPEVDLWLDVDEFENHVRNGRRLEVERSLVNASAEYEAAISLYQGDFLSSDLYEEWPVLTRERLRVAYLETLDRLSHIYFKQEQYAVCATLCQLLLRHDNCREDAYCRLMRCYSRLEQYHLALREYQSCVDALRTELNVTPAQSTTRLFESIRRHEWV